MMVSGLYPDWRILSIAALISGNVRLSLCSAWIIFVSAFRCAVSPPMPKNSAVLPVIFLTIGMSFVASTIVFAASGIPSRSATLLVAELPALTPPRTTGAKIAPVTAPSCAPRTRSPSIAVPAPVTAPPAPPTTDVPPNAFSDVGILDNKFAACGILLATFTAPAPAAKANGRLPITSDANA